MIGTCGIYSGIEIIRIEHDELVEKALRKAKYYLDKGFTKIEIHEIPPGKDGYGYEVHYHGRKSNMIGEPV